MPGARSERSGPKCLSASGADEHLRPGSILLCHVAEEVGEWFAELDVNSERVDYGDRVDPFNPDPVIVRGDRRIDGTCGVAHPGESSDTSLAHRRRHHRGSARPCATRNDRRDHRPETVTRSASAGTSRVVGDASSSRSSSTRLSKICWTTRPVFQPPKEQGGSMASTSQSRAMLRVPVRCDMSCAFIVFQCSAQTM